MLYTQKKPPSGNFFIVPNCIFNEKLKARELAVYCDLMRRADRTTFTCYPSRKTIANDCCMSEPTVDTAIEILENAGLISVTRRYDGSTGNRLSHIYTINKIW